MPPPYASTGDAVSLRSYKGRCRVAGPEDCPQLSVLRFSYDEENMEVRLYKQKPRCGCSRKYSCFGVRRAYDLLCDPDEGRFELVTKDSMHAIFAQSED